MIANLINKKVYVINIYNIHFFIVRKFYFEKDYYSEIIIL